jgi:hypothetical protein
MADVSYQDAVQLLRDRMGMRWEGFEDDGRDEMVRYLKEFGNYSTNEAHDLIQAMIDAGELRYRREPPTPSDDVAVAAAAPIATGTTSSGTGLPTPLPAMVGGMGYWQIGSQDEFVEVGRAGQVKPRGL